MESWNYHSHHGTYALVLPVSGTSWFPATSQLVLMFQAKLWSKCQTFATKIRGPKKVTTVVSIRTGHTIFEFPEVSGSLRVAVAMSQNIELHLSPWLVITHEHPRRVGENGQPIITGL